MTAADCDQDDGRSFTDERMKIAGTVCMISAVNAGKTFSLLCNKRYLGRFVSRSPLMRLLWIIQFESAIRITVCGRRKPRRCPSRRQRRPQAVPSTVNSRSNVQQPRALLVPKRPRSGSPPVGCRSSNAIVPATAWKPDSTKRQTRAPSSAMM